MSESVLPEQHHEISYSGTTGGLFPIVLMNLLLMIITLGIYHFWAKTNIRKYLWSNTRFDGEPFEYTGTGGELFIGALIVGFLFIAPFALGLVFLLNTYPLIAPFALVALYPFFIFLIGVAIYRAQVYRMSRTRWRSIRGAQLPKSAAYGWLTLKYAVLYILTFGLIMPYVLCRMWNFMMNNKRLGSGVFSCDVKSKPLFKIWLRTILATIIVIGGFFYLLFDAAQSKNIGMIIFSYLMIFISMPLIFAWFYAAALSHLFSGLKFQDVAVNFHIKPVEFLIFSFVNMVILIFTLGLGAPFIIQRWTRLICEKITLDGKVDFAQIAQSPEYGPAFGEGLVEAFDIG